MKLIVLSLLLLTDDPVIQGEYVEARTCDVWTGPCFANGEINLRGKHAVAAWIVDKGSWDKVTLDGLKILAVFESEGTLHTDVQGEVRAVIYVDERATDAQSKALVAMAKALAPKHLSNVLRTHKAAIRYTRNDLEVKLSVGKEVTLETRALGKYDAVCCNEEQAYPSISESVEILCAKTVEHAYQGTDIGTTWSDPNRRSAMVGTFSR